MKVEKNRDNKPKSRVKSIILGTVIAFGIVILFIAIWAFFRPTITYAGNDNINSNINPQPTENTLQRNCHDVQVPYQDTETYTTYLQSQVASATSEEKFSLKLGEYVYAQVQLKNVDNQAGWFTVIFKWHKFNTDWQDSVRHYISPDQTVQFESTYDIDAGEKWTNEYAYNSDPIENTRQVTKYRTEQQCD